MIPVIHCRFLFAVFPQYPSKPIGGHFFSQARHIISMKKICHIFICVHFRHLLLLLHRRTVCSIYRFYSTSLLFFLPPSGLNVICLGLNVPFISSKIRITLPQKIRQKKGFLKPVFSGVPNLYFLILCFCLYKQRAPYAYFTWCAQHRRIFKVLYLKKNACYSE